MKLAAIRAPGQDAVQKSLTTLHAAVAQHIVQGRKDLLVRQVSGGAKKDQCVRTRIRHKFRFIWLTSPDARQIQTAWPRAICPGNPHRRVS